MNEQDKINQAITATKRVMRALQRQCLPDLVTAWQELRTLAGVHPLPLPEPQRHLPWGRMAEEVWTALDAASGECACWAPADWMVRWYTQSEIAWELECGDEAKAERYRAFVEGK